MKTLWVIPAVVSTFLSLLNGCDPEVDGFEPPSGFARQIVKVVGNNLDDATITFRHQRTGTEYEVIQSYGSATYFQIPKNASAGTYQIEVSNMWGSSESMSFVVGNLDLDKWPKPRIEDITIRKLTNVEDDRADIFLAIPVANVDADAKVRVNGINLTDVVFRSALPVNYFSSDNHEPNTFGYPIFHYGLLSATLTGQKLAEELTIEVQNGDASAMRAFSLPNRPEELDSDNDGLLDKWERDGYSTPDGGIINLEKIGCDPQRKDILVQVNWIENAEPNVAIWSEIETFFKTAPVLNPDGTSGIAIHIDHGSSISASDASFPSTFAKGGLIPEKHSTLDFCDLPIPRHANFYDYKNKYFNRDRLGIFHYCVFGVAMPDASSGRGEIAGDDFFVTLGVFPESEDAGAQVGSFIHELGHNLALRHGGISNEAPDQDEMGKPNQPSLMNYRYQLWGIPNDVDLYPDGVHDYSAGMYRPMNEAEVIESEGLADNQAIDFNPSPLAGISTSPMEINLSGGRLFYPLVFAPDDAEEVDGYAYYVTTWDDNDVTDVHHDYDEWGNLKLDFPLSDCSTCDYCTGTVGGTLYYYEPPFENLTPHEDTCNVLLELESIDTPTTYTDDDHGDSCSPRTNCGFGFGDVVCGRYKLSAVICHSGQRFYYISDSVTTMVPDDTASATIITVTADTVINVNFVVERNPIPPLVPVQPTQASDSSNSRLLVEVTSMNKRFGRFNTSSVSGTVDTSMNTDITFTPASGADILIKLILPGNMSLFPTTNSPSTLFVEDFSDVRGADHMVTLRTTDSLLFGYIWKVDDTPIHLDSVPGVVLVQEPLTTLPTENGFVLVPVLVNGVRYVGRVFEFSAGGRMYVAYIHTSMYQNSTLNGMDGKNGYVLKAIVVEK